MRTQFSATGFDVTTGLGRCCALTKAIEMVNDTGVKDITPNVVRKDGRGEGNY